MSRYSKTPLRKSKGKVKYSTSRFSSIPLLDSDIFVITQDGDRLDTLAYEFYGDSTLWWYLAKANNLTDMHLEAGVQLRIPGTTAYAKVL